MGDDPVKIAVIEAMRDEPFQDDVHLLGTSQQDDRMAHYARIACAVQAAEIARFISALKITHDLMECIEQTTNNVWWVNADDPETAVCDVYSAVESALAVRAHLLKPAGKPRP